jgi:hypothetical protein
MLIVAMGTCGDERKQAVDAVLEEVAKNPHLFSAVQDGDPYEWLSQLSCYSPIVHLQQTDNTASAHKAFTEEHNTNGIIEPLKVLRAIQVAYDRPVDASMPPRVEEIYLTLEMFSGTADKAADILERMRVSADYWRKTIPSDGQTLDEVLRV